MKKIVLIIFIIIISTLSITFAKEFNDVPKTHWAYKYADILSDMSVLNGYKDGSFGPSKKITKAEYIKLLVGTVISKADSEYIANNMSSTKNWYDLYVEYAKVSSLLSDNYTDDKLKEEVERIDMVRMLEPFVKYIQYGFEQKEVDLNKELSKKDLENAYGVQKDEEVNIINDMSKYKVEKIDTNIQLDYFGFDNVSIEDNEKVQKLFNDVSLLKNGDKKALLFLYDNGLISGYDDGSFKPHQTMNRAEVATIIYKVMKLVEKGGSK